jgi:hypothetical protein
MARSFRSSRFKRTAHDPLKSNRNRAERRAVRAALTTQDDEQLVHINYRRA